MKRILIFICAFLPVLFLSLSVEDITFLLTNWAIGIYAICKISFVDKKELDCGFSLFNSNTMLYLFVYFFLCIAPLSQFSSHINLWGGVPLRSESYIKANVIFIFAIIIYQLSYSFFLYNYNNRKVYNSKAIEKINISILLLISLFSFFITIYHFRNTPILLFLRELNRGGGEIILDKNSFGNTSIDLIYTIFLRPIPVFALVILNYVHKKGKVIIKILLLLICILSNFPLAVSRFYVAAIYLPLFISFFPNLLHKEHMLKVSVIIGLLYIFPFLNQGRRVMSFKEIEISFAPNYQMFNQGHFDTYQNAARVFENETITYGNQLLGSIFFFIPRSIWPSKPIGSGGFIAKKYNLNFSHISLNFWGEGFINFGYFGVFLFSILIAFLNFRYDELFSRSEKGSLGYLLYTIYLGTLFFFLRGDLISSIAYLVGLLFSAYFVYFIAIKESK